MHLVDTDAGVMGTSAVVGTTIANAVGYAYAFKPQRRPAIVASFFGDGATEEGVFYESLNFAALKRLPILFICENNGYAIHTHQTRRQASSNIVGRAAAFGMPAERIENNDILKVHERVSAAADRLRAGQASGPFFFECETYRWKEHVGPGEDFHLGYRGENEAQPWVEHDQVRRLAELVPAVRREAIEAEVEAEIRDAFAAAEAAPFPEPAELFTDVFAPAQLTETRRKAA